MFGVLKNALWLWEKAFLNQILTIILMDQKKVAHIITLAKNSQNLKLFSIYSQKLQCKVRSRMFSKK